VVLNGLGDPAEIERARAEMEQASGAAVRFHGADMTKPAEIADLIAYAEREFGRLDILVNNAGVQHVAAVDEFPPEKWDFIIAVNLTAVFHATRAAVPLMKGRGRGRIVNVASAHSLVASPFKSAYVAAKHGVAGFTKSVALELAQTGVTCNAISPGYVRTPLVEGQIADQAKARGISEEAVMRDVILAAQPNKRFVGYDELAGLLLYLVSDLGASANGANFSVDGGWTAQ
jgi:3-hydroxybutyrate dehydrogenase